MGEFHPKRNKYKMANVSQLAIAGFWTLTKSKQQVKKCLFITVRNVGKKSVILRPPRGGLFPSPTPSLT